MLSTSFCAVPAFSRVEPVTTSGPTITSTAWWAARESGTPALQESPTVRAPSLRASLTAATTNGARPLAEIPTTESSGPASCSRMAAAPASASSSAPSTDRVSAGTPPAMMPRTTSGSVPKVGGHSEASSTASRPDVPAPT